MPASDPAPCRLLLLGGTGEAAALARLLDARWGARLDVRNALAGRTENPGRLPGIVRIGGFGGADGLRRYLVEEAIDLVIDATHPFADQIARHAQIATEAAAVPRLKLLRPPWRRDPLDRWIEVEDVAGAAAVLPRLPGARGSACRAGRRVFLSLGSQDIAAFAGLDGFFLLRTIDALRQPPPFADCVALTGRGPFSIAGEEALLRAHRIAILVSRASGGADTEAKTIAARRLGLPVVMIRRPVPQPGARVESVEEAAEWVAMHLQASAGEQACRA
jgi:precorrin-6A/cobalt-precorrin-6A reductase